MKEGETDRGSEEGRREAKKKGERSWLTSGKAQLHQTRPDTGSRVMKKTDKNMQENH